MRENFVITVNALPSPSRYCLALTVSMITCLTLIINVSFKLVMLGPYIFTANSIICTLFAGLYLLVIKNCTLDQQRRILNQCLITLYLYSMGIYLLVNLPAAEHMQIHIDYQIVFEEIPRKFFSSTVAFILSFYIPHLYCFTKKTKENKSKSGNTLMRALGGGFLFFSLNFLLLFFDPMVKNFGILYLTSWFVSLLTLFTIALGYFVYLTIDWPKKTKNWKFSRKVDHLTSHSGAIYYSLASFSVVILLISLACEYRLVMLMDQWMVSASSILSPLILLVACLVSELYGSKACVRLLAILIISELAFDFTLMATVTMPSPNFLDLNPFFWAVMPRRIPGTTLTLVIAFLTNIIALEKLKTTVYGMSTALRFALANIIANSALCIVNYLILFMGVYPYDQVLHLVITSWVYRFCFVLVCLPFFLLLNNSFKNRVQKFAIF